MFIRTLIFAAAFLGTTVAASAEPFGAANLTTPARAEAPRLQPVAATSTDAAYVSPLAATSVICKSEGGAVAHIYVVSVENGRCGGLAGDHAQCLSREPMSQASASCETGCSKVSGTGKCIAY